MSMRRTLIVLCVLIVLIGIGVGIYFLFFRGAPAATPGNGGQFPGDGGNVEPATTTPDIGTPVTEAGQEVAPKLFKITDGPVALGVSVFRVAASQATDTPSVAPDVEVRYVERASGNIYRYRAGARTLERLTNTTLPGIQEAKWASDGSRAFVRFLSNNTGADRIETYALLASEAEGYFLQPDLGDVVVGTSTVLSVLPSTSGSIGTTATLEGAKPATLFTSTLSALRVFSAGANYAAITKPSASLPGYAFLITRDGQFTRLLGPLAGLTLLPSPSGTKFLYGSSANGTLQLGLLDIVNIGTIALPVNTIADKCVWTSDSTAVYCAVPRTVSGTLPDDWYQGVFPSSDRIWKIDLVSRVSSLVFDPLVLANTDIDAVALAIDPASDALVFTNKRDGSLWLYDL